MKVMFIKPAMETDAVWDPIRSAIYLGLWYMASLLKQRDHEVRYLDETLADYGGTRQQMFIRTLQDEVYFDYRLERSFRNFHTEKIVDFTNLSPVEFVKKYSAFKEDGSICRTLVRTGNNLEKTIDKALEFCPNFIGIPLISSANYWPAVKLGKAIKEAGSHTKVIFGGQHISADPEGFLEENPWVDQVVVGDAISVIADIIEGRNADRIVRGGQSKMAEFPLLDPSIIGKYVTDEPNHAFSTNGRKAIEFMFSRGCPGRCEFCVAGSNGCQFSEIDLERLDAQLKLFKSHGIEELIIQDDAFLFQAKKRLPLILSLMKQYGFCWQDNGGLDFEMLDDFVTDQFIKYNSEGQGRLTALYIPFNPRIWNKRDSAAGSMIGRFAKNFANLKRLHEAGIYVFTSEIIGTPDQTMEILENDIELHKRMIGDGHVSAVLTLMATLLPGTKWHREHRHWIINELDYPGYSLFTAHHHTDNIPDPRMLEEMMVRRQKTLNAVQDTYAWGSAFPNK